MVKIHLCYILLDKYSTGDTERKRGENKKMCFNPLKGFIGENNQVFKVTKKDVVALKWDVVNEKWRKYYDEKDVPIDAYVRFIDIPCRSCEECYNQMRKEWISRAVAESQLHNSMIFLTLTYNDDKIPVSEFVDDDGVIWKHNTLRYRDFQLFMKRLRKHFEEKSIRFMVCGEYGSRTFRPHYHCIIYGISLQDLGLCIPHTKNSQGDTLYTNNLLDSLWRQGYILVSDANTSTMAYVAGYVAKKSVSQKGKKFYETAKITPPFIKSSNRPGLGSEWFEKNINRYNDIYDYICVSSSTGSDPTKLFLTSNWKSKFENKLCDEIGLNGYVENYEVWKTDRRVKLVDNRFKLLRTDMDKESYNSSCKYNFRNSLKRKRGVY